MLYVWDICCGTSSVAKALPNESIVGFDITPRHTPSNVVKVFTRDIRDFTIDEIIDIAKKYPPKWIWASPPCTEFTIIKQSVHTRNIAEGKSIFNAVNRIIFTIINHFNARIKYAVENPKSPIARRLWAIEYPFVRDLCYCKYNKKMITKDGYEYDTFKYRKKTIIGTNIRDIFFKVCKMDCDSSSATGSHDETISFISNPKSHYWRLRKLKLNNVYSDYNDKDYLHRVPEQPIQQINSKVNKCM